MKKTVMLVVLFLVVGSLLVVADGGGDACFSFWRKMSCFLFRGEAVVGKAKE